MHPGQQLIEFGIGLGQPGERAERIGLAVGRRIVGSALRRVPCRAELVCLRRTGLCQKRIRLIDTGLNVGDRRGQVGQGPVDVGGRAVHGVEQRPGLIEG